MLLIYIFAYVFVPVTDCTCVCIGCTPQLHSCSLPRHCRSDPVFWPCWPGFTCLLPYEQKQCDHCCVQTRVWFCDTFTSVFAEERSTVLSLGEKSWARSSRSMCCGWYNWRRSLSQSTVLFAALWHCRELSDEWYYDHIPFKFWLLWQLMLAVPDRSPPILRCQQSVPSVSSTTELPQRVCCSALAGSH